MSENVVKLQVHEVGENYRFQAIEVLDGARDQKFERMVVIGRTEEGELYVAGTANAGESLILIEHAKHFIAFGVDAANAT